jgi:hypothetical protein
MDKKLLDIVYQLIDANKNSDKFDFKTLWRRHYGGCPSMIPYSKEHAKFLVEELTQADLQNLIQGLVRYSCAVGARYSGGSASPVVPLYYVFTKKYPEAELDLTAWVVENSVNSRYEPGVKWEKDYKPSSRTPYISREDEVRHEERLARQAVLATENLPNAIRRGDLKAVDALLARGADVDQAIRIVGPLGQVAIRYGRESMKLHLESKGIE